MRCRLRPGTERRGAHGPRLTLRTAQSEAQKSPAAGRGKRYTRCSKNALKSAAKICFKATNSLTLIFMRLVSSLA